MARFDEQVNLQFASPRTGAAQGLTGLANKFERLRQEKAAQRERRVIAEQAQAGQQAFKKGEKPQFMDEERLIGGVSAKAYNKGLRAAYLASLSNDVREDLATLERENATDSAAYQNAITAHREALSSQVDPSVMPEVLARFDDAASRGMVRVQDKEFRLQREEQISTVNDAIASAGNDAARFARTGDLDSAAQSLVSVREQLDLAVDAEIIGQDQADEAFGRLQREAIEQENRFNFENIAETQGFPAAYRALDDIAGKPPKGWSPDEWKAYITDQQAELGRKERRLEEQKLFTEAELEKARNFANIEKRLAEGDERIVMDEKAVNEYYVDLIQPNIQNLPVDQRDAVVANYIDKTKVVPSSVKAQVTNNIRSGNPELIAESSAFIARLDDVPGVSEDLANPNERAFAQVVVDLMANMIPEEAVRVARAATDPKDEARIKAVDEQIKQQFKGFGSSSKTDWFKEQARETFSSFLSVDPDVDPLNEDQMGKEWGDAWEAHRRAGMDDEAARKAASGVIKRNWSEFNGQVMKYAPDVYYGTPDGDNQYIIDQLTADIRKDSFQPVKLEQIKLVSDDRTSRMAALGQPDYAVMVVQESGEIFRYPPTFRWSPDLGAELERRTTENATEASERRKSHTSAEQQRIRNEALKGMRSF
jgi:ribosomal protein S20